VQTCVCGKGFVSVYALKNHVAKGWVGSSHDRLPECRPRFGIAYIISDVSHPNPYQSLLAAHAMRVVSRSSEDEPSTSVKEQCVTAAMSKLNRIVPDNCKALLSSDNLSGLMTLKKVCMYCELTARHSVRTKEAGQLGIVTLYIQQMCARGVDFGMIQKPPVPIVRKTEQQILARLSLHAKIMLVTCWLETLANKDDPTNLIFTVVYDHRNVLKLFGFSGGTVVQRPVRASGTASTAY